MSYLFTVFTWSFLAPPSAGNFHKGKLCLLFCLLTHKSLVWTTKQDHRAHSPMPGAAMRILEMTTCVMACFAALVDSPKRVPFSSVTGIPTLSSLKGRTHTKVFTDAFGEHLEGGLCWERSSASFIQFPTQVSFLALISLFLNTTNRFKPPVIDVKGK